MITNPHISREIAHEHQRDLVAQADQQRLVRQARTAAADRRQLDRAVTLTGRERLRSVWYRLRLTVAEMNYASRRMVELREPSISENSRELDLLRSAS